MSAELIHEPVTAIAVRERAGVALTPVMDLSTALARLNQFQEFCAKYLCESADGGDDGGDYGAIPGTKRKTLLKSGADKLCEIYGLYDDYEFLSVVEDWDKGLFDYKLKCLLKSRRDDSLAGSGLGSCSSYESKYRWRQAQRKCPRCGKENIRRSNKPGEGWYCWRKTDGCGATFKEGDPTIENQLAGRVENPDMADVKNTVLKMAKKRAKIDAVIGVTRSSGIFTQDMDESAPAEAPAATYATIAEDIEIGTPPAPPAAPKAVEPAPAAPTEIKYASTIQAQALHRKFREALPYSFQLQADDILHHWLKRHGYVDAQGEPTAYAIPRHELKAAGEEALDYARFYDHPVPDYNDPIPF